VYEKRYNLSNIFQNILLLKTGLENHADRAPLNMVQALTGHPLAQRLNKYCIFNCKKKKVYLLSKANGVYRVESLIFQTNTLMRWLIDENLCLSSCVEVWNISSASE